ncbi:hypothetical protein cand_014510 [Cryptosporidium andersoni]|uniref:tRNA pseudouridine(55) synthase n=1 Tax=Cryptosporidium andersoni TaxID=117008 RepID=A0A1J4MVZ5_9CRYT|nr:hypothetical protein cand_014510 [Cryptosporidium andersoni]
MNITYKCWRCDLRSKPCHTEEFKFFLYNFDVSEERGNICNYCNDLLLLDNTDVYHFVEIPNSHAQRNLRRRRHKKLIKDNKQNIRTFLVCKLKSPSNNKVDISMIISEILKLAVSGDNGTKVVSFGVSIEFLFSNLKNEGDNESYFSLKACLRHLLLKSVNLEQNQGSDLYLNFTISSSIPFIENDMNYIFCISISYEWKPIYISGRYKKLSRRISQSIWHYNSSNNVNDSQNDDNLYGPPFPIKTSIEDILNYSLNKLISYKKCTFSASGREDVDVRMLGVSNGGRPFALEISGISSKHHLFYSNIVNPSINDNIQLRSEFISELISNVKLSSGGHVSISQVSFSNAGLIKKMNIQVSEKLKAYSCICYTTYNLSPQNYEKLRNQFFLYTLPISIKQRTPIRVLHRRKNTDRIRNIFNINIKEINENSFKLDLITEAGMYIKEFVHGDFGRTVPNLGDIIQKVINNDSKGDSVRIDVCILQLDVLDVLDNS